MILGIITGEVVSIVIKNECRRVIFAFVWEAIAAAYSRALVAQSEKSKGTKIDFM
ncbi:MAG: hypothetical protein OHK0038_13230 [Flammeovirgaceae bacterium]